MTCYSPLQGYRSAHLTSNGKRPIVFKIEYALGYSIGLKPELVCVPCGRCIGCRLEYSRQWAIRCVHEASCYQSNVFITLTFDNEHLARRTTPGLDKRDFQLFMKRLRKEFGQGVRYYHCGEYGENFGRPHYHALIFNLDFTDKYLWQMRGQNRLYRSPTLERLWPFGYSSIGEVTFESAAYVARYVMKKITGDPAALHYTDISQVDDHTGELIPVQPEYSTMSRRPGIGKKWFDKYYKDVYAYDRVVVGSAEGKPTPVQPPRFYDSQFELLSPSEYATVKVNRKRKAKLFQNDNTPSRLDVKRRVKEAQVSRLSRSLPSVVKV